MEGEGGHPLSQQKLIFNDDIDVLPAHRAVCRKGYIGGNVQRARIWEFQERILGTRSSLEKSHGYRAMYFCSRVPVYQ